VDKLKPTFDLDSIKAAFSTVAKLRITRTAQDDAVRLGFGLQGAVDIIQGMRRDQFYKSMPSYRDARTWQDVYHVPIRPGLVLYVKFTIDLDGELVLSFKEK
jgi:motility quorum-sensing regulator/GCU-specific mRNA interferase toxin